MKVLVVLCAVVASCLASPSAGFGYAYSAISPLTGYGSYAAPYSYAYSAPIISTSYAAPYAAAPLAVPVAAPLAHPVAVAPAPIAAPVKTQYHSQNEIGEAKYGHSEPLQRHDAVQDAHGNKVGSYSYVDNHGSVHQTNYVADALGYRAASNDLPLGPAGDTLEVAAAKAHHFAAHANAVHRYRRSLYSGNVHGWGIPAVLANGHIADTPEVAAAKHAHFAEVAKASGHSAHAGHSAHYAPAAPAYSGHYAGPYAAPVVTPSGHLADTPEVAAAKAAHFAEHAKAAGHGHSGHYAAAPYAASAYSGHYATAYTHSNGPWAVPVVKPDGFLADTPEVAAAKSAHFAEVAHRGKRSIFYQTPASTSPLFPAAPIVPVAYAPAPVAYAPAPVAHAAPLAYAAPLAHASPVLGVPAIRTDIVHNPGHAVSFRID